MSNRDLSFYIVDILLAIDKIRRYTDKFTNPQDLLYDELSWDATIRELEVIGEATKYLLDTNLIGDKNRRIVNFRNQISHGYFGIDENIVWDVVTMKLTMYRDELMETLKSNNIDIGEAIKYMRNEHYINEYMVKVLDELEEYVR